MECIDRKIDNKIVILFQNVLSESGSIYAHRELLTTSCEGRRIELLTISSVDGINSEVQEPAMPGLFPEHRTTPRCLSFPQKQIVFVSARVHPGAVIDLYNVDICVVYVDMYIQYIVLIPFPHMLLVLCVMLDSFLCLIHSYV